MPSGRRPRAGAPARVTRRAALAGSAFAAVAAAGCTARSTSNGPVNRILRYALTSDPTNLDPAMVEDGTTIDVLQNIYDGLVRWNVRNEIEPNIAEKWDVSPDGRTYTFHLRKDASFHNGRKVTAEDFRYSIERACDPALASPTAPTYLKDIVGVQDRLNRKAPGVSGVRAPDPYTLQITIDSFKPYWLGNLTYPTGYVVCREAVEKGGGRLNEHNTIGSGPFKLKQYRRGYSLTLENWAAYHYGVPQLIGIERPIIKDGSTRLSKYQAGELDYLEVSPADLSHINSDPALKPDLHTFPRAIIWYIALNSAAPGSPFGDVRVRRAFAMAIDRKAVVHIALKDTMTVANGFVTPGIAAYQQTTRPLPYDPAQARALLAQAGFPNGNGFPILPIAFRQDQPEVAQTAEVVAAQVKQNLGVELQIRPMEWGELLRERLRKSIPVIHLRWGADYLDPQDFLSVLLHTDNMVNGVGDHPENGVGYSNPKFDLLCDHADVEHDPKLRMEMYHQAEQLAMDEAPVVPIYYQNQLELMRPYVKGIRDSLFGHLPHLTTTVAR